MVVLLIAAGVLITKPWVTKTEETISINAEGKTQVVPNVAKISASVETKNDNLDTARQQNEQKVSNLIESLKTIGVEEKDIKTQNISAGPGVLKVSCCISEACCSR